MQGYFLESSRTSAVLSNYSALRFPSKAIHYSRTRKFKKSIKTTVCDNYFKRTFEFSYQNLKGINYRTSNKGNFKTSLSMRKIFRTGQSLILAILGKSQFSCLEICISSPAPVRSQLMYSIIVLLFEFLRKDFETRNKCKSIKEMLRIS